MTESRVRRLALALHEGRDHTRDGVELGDSPICNCFELAVKVLPVAREFCAEAWDDSRAQAILEVDRALIRAQRRDNPHSRASTHSRSEEDK